jgi:ABC-type sugar transport system ATPase subunit
MKSGALLKLDNIHKKFPGVYALNNVSFEVFPAEVHALMGENGAGKSTLIKIISGALKEDSGNYYLNGEKVEITSPKDAIRKKISVIYQELSLAKNLSVAENIFLGNLPLKSLGRVDYDVLYDMTSQVLNELKLPINPRLEVKYLTIAKQQLVEIAKSIAKNPKIIIMDEPTSALSRNEIESLFGIIDMLRAKGTAVVYVSHKLEEVFRISRRITVLRDGGFVGTYPTSEIDENKLVSLMVGRPLSAMVIRNHAESAQKQNEKGVLEVECLSTDYVHDISFSVKTGEIIGFSGLMGSGRTELCRALFGLDYRRSGRILVDGKELVKNSPERAVEAGLGLIPENRKDDGIFPQLSVRDNMTLVALKGFSKWTKIKTGSELDAVAKMIRNIKIKTPSPKQRIANLSGGNQQKVIVARWLMEGACKVLIIDEPTRGIDIGAKSDIYALLGELAAMGMAILVMSSEMTELLGISSRIYVLKSGRINGCFNAGDVTQEELLIAAS